MSNPQVELHIKDKGVITLELDQEKCHWPIGDPGQPDFFFCGGKTNTGTPYCGYHGRVAYQPPAARRDRRPSR